MHVAHLTLHDFRSYADIDVALEPGATAFIGRNGQGKTNLVEAIDYLSRLSSHRVATDAPLVRAGADQAIVRASVVKEGRPALIEVELNPGRANRARINRSPAPPAPRDRRPRAHGGLLPRRPDPREGRPVGPAQVPGRPADPALAEAGRRAGRLRPRAQAAQQPPQDGRRRPWLVTRRGDVHARDLGRQPGPRRRRDPRRPAAARRGPAPLPRQGLRGRRPRCEPRRRRHRLQGQRRRLGEPVEEVAQPGARDPLEAALLDAIAARRKEELDRGISLVGPHRDELLLSLGDPQLRLPVKGYASHGESWSFALALRLASYDLLRADGDDPILVLDDVFAELDAERRQQLAELVAGAEQVLVTAAVAADVPASLQGVRYLVADGQVTRDD